MNPVISQVSGAYTVNLKLDLIDYEMKSSFDVLTSGQRHEGRRYAAVLVLRELAFSMPTFFFQNVWKFFRKSSRYDVHKIFWFFTPSPLPAFGSDFYYKIHATSLTISALP